MRRLHSGETFFFRAGVTAAPRRRPATRVPVRAWATRSPPAPAVGHGTAPVT
ncbi:hypothetical protein ACRAWF_32130 [Streptomyces sp. L7]